MSQSPSVPRAVNHHSISSPPPPPVYHRAMITYHQYLLDRQAKPDLDFLTYWFGETNGSDVAISPDDGTSDIINGIVLFRNKVVEQCRGKYISLLAVRGIVFDLQRDSRFPESKEYWGSVLESLQHQPSSSVPIADMSEAVISFLKSIGSPDESSHASEAPNSAVVEELESLRNFVNSSMREMRSEIRRESAKLKSEMVAKISETSAASTAAPSRESSSKPSPVPVPALPIETRRAQEPIQGNRSLRRSWCASCADDVCLMQ